jgi:phosphoenolpyruvate phosphomutase
MDLASLLRQPGLTVILGAHDALSARLAEEARNDAVWVSSLGVTSTLGLPDTGVITMREMMHVADQIRRMVDGPVLVDCDTGFGAAQQVFRMVGEAVALGIDGVCIEDHATPKLNSFTPGAHRLVTVEEFSTKISAAVAARRASQLAIVARTEALAQGHSVKAALDRARAYVDRGADAVIVQTTYQDLQVIEQFMTGWDRTQPVGVIPTGVEGAGFRALADLGLSFVVYANQALRAAIHAMRAAYASIEAEQGRLPLAVELATMDETLALQQPTTHLPGTR